MDFLGKVASQALDSKKEDQPPQQQSTGADALLGKLGSFAGQQQQTQQPQQQQQSGAGGLLDKLHGLAGGGPESEHKEDGLDKGAFPSAKCTAWWVETRKLNMGRYRLGPGECVQAGSPEQRECC